MISDSKQQLFVLVTIRLKLIREMANGNTVDILGRLEREKQEQEARLESLQLKARTLKRRREELSKSLSDISQQSDAREAGLSAASRFSCSSVSTRQGSTFA